MVKVSPLLTIIFVVLFALPPAFAQTISLTVVVVDGQGNSVPNIPVAISSDMPTMQAARQNTTFTQVPFSVSGTTDASGQFRCDLPGPGIYHVTIKSVEYDVNLTHSVKSEETVTVVWSGEPAGANNPMDQPGTIGFSNRQSHGLLAVYVLLATAAFVVVFLVWKRHRG